MNKKRRRIIEANEVSQLREVELAGYRQKILIEGKSAKNPVAVFLHGGPGSPIPFSVGCRGLFPEFTDHLIMVYWDQLGCGINNREIGDDFTIDKFADMTVDLIKEIHREFPHNKLFLVAMSYGTVLAVKAAGRVPELIEGVLAIGQVRKELAFNREVYEALDRAPLPSKKKILLEKIKEKEQHDQKDIKAIMSMVQKYTEGYQAKNGGKVPMGSIIFGLLTSPDYTFKDFCAIMNNGYIQNRSLWKELHELDLSPDLEAVEVPYRILQGSTDIVTSTAGMKEFVENCGNPRITIRIMENCGHMPGKEAMDIVMQECLNRV